MFNRINRHGQQQQSNSAPCTMEPMEDRILMASDYLRPGGFEPMTATNTMTVSAPTTGILIGLLLPAVQKASI